MSTGFLDKSLISVFYPSLIFYLLGLFSKWIGSGFPLSCSDKLPLIFCCLTDPTFPQITVLREMVAKGGSLDYNYN